MTLTSVSAFAGYCEVDMVNRYNRVVRTYTSYDEYQGCKEAMKQCRFANRTQPHLGGVDCVRKSDTYPNPQPQPNPYPYPNPQPQPNPYPYPDTNPYPGSVDARRVLTTGETVVYNNRNVTIAGISFQGLYAVRSTDGWNTITNGVSRDQLAVTSGCALNICVNDSVINTISARYVTVAGIHFNESLVTRSTDGWNTLTSNVSNMNIAETKGCLDSRYSRVCVGDTVINNYNRYSTIAGIQRDGRVVLKSQDGWNTLTTNVDPSSLVVTGSTYPRR